MTRFEKSLLLERAIETAIKDAENKELPQLCSDVGAFALPGQRRFLNTLVRETKHVGPYLEVGCHIGGTFISALHENGGRGIGIDNFSDCLTKPAAEIRAELRCNLEMYSVNADVIEADFFRWTFTTEAAGAAVYFYDGNHSRPSHYEAVMRCVEIQRPFVMVIDDYGWTDVQNGTIEAVQALRARHIKFRPFSQMGRRFNNGFGIFLVEDV